MYPNPQDVLPLPLRPSVEQYKKLAKDLVKACKSADRSAIEAWALQWVEKLAELQPDLRGMNNPRDIGRRAHHVAEFATKKLSGGDAAKGACGLANAQFVIARGHGFLSWPQFVTHLESLAQDHSPVAGFEAAANAIVTGDVPTLQRLLRENPGLSHARSMREHHATLLHYVSANGVENYRQVTPKNIAEITEILLAAGAEVDAEAQVYGGNCTPLGLTATSAHPANAGVQLDVMDVLLRHGADLRRRGTAGHRHLLVRACLANGQPEAAAYLAERGAPLDLPGAAGLGRVDALRTFFSDDGALQGCATRAEWEEGFSLACGYGHADAVRFLLDRGMEVDTQLDLQGEGHTGLHVAAYHGHLDVVEALLDRGANVHTIDKTWGTPPLIWALTGWKMHPDHGAYHEVAARLVAAGAGVRSDLLEWDPVRADPRMLAILSRSTPSTEDR